MRPEILYPLFTPVTRLKGIGPNLGRLVERAIGANLIDLLWHLPVGIIDRRFRPPVADAQPGSIATLTVTVDAHWPPASSRMPYRVRCSDDSGAITVTFFRAKGEWIEKILPLGSTRIISGKVEAFNDQLQMSHPDHIAAPDDTEGADAVLSVEPVYRLTAGITLKTLRKAADSALSRTPELPEWLDASLLERERWSGWRTALVALHHPETMTDIDPSHPARLRLAYDELLADQLALALIRQRNRAQNGRAISGDGRLRDAVLASLPFKPTGAQTQAMAEISADMASNRRMLRLLQGDVGSGKTLVALMAMLSAVESGSQAALMAPTEILARQHAATLTRMLAPIGIVPVLLTGRDKGKPRTALLAAIADGGARIVIGTHALYQDDIVFQDLAVAVIDEQHRFGVEQRMSLASKGRGVDILVMTATPIPRSLMLAGYGDLDVSYLREKPAGRQKITTSLISTERLGETAAAVGRALKSGTKVYWICPLIEESETSDLAAAEERHAMLKTMFGDRVGLLHGRMKGAERDRVMTDFAHGSTDLLVATTVVEVGVDVPAATVMIIEHAERFGLAQLHQLRGRIGRGSDASSCLLLYAGPLGETAKARLKIMRETEDGFRIAEEDLRLRGAGEMLGTKQSGLPEYRLADLAIHGELLAMAHDEARLILHRDAELAQPRGAALRTLLYLFERESAIRYLKSG